MFDDGLHPAAHLQGPGVPLLGFAGIDFVDVDAKDQSHHSAVEEPEIKGEGQGAEQRDQTEHEGQRGAEYRKEQVGSIGTSCIEDDGCFKEGNHQHRQAESNGRRGIRYREPVPHRCDDESDDEKRDASAKFGLISEVRGRRAVVLPDAVQAVDHGENSDADGNDFNHIRQLQHEQDCDEQFSQNHDDFIDVTVERSGHVGLPPV